ncbi:uncharacterized protein LOC107037295 [Diachasma alloeum]|uniref:uncharacterized protein LOC107037295 n=1 Tax=Diachasma alloeum TaxID=454923 RepID=UPI00073818B2|nr:uncharacterized protein LOC107037295 [Diachasma alloeum]
MAVSQLRVMMARGGFTSCLQRIATKPARHSFKTKTEVSPEDPDDELNKPIVYSESPAATWAARHSFSGTNDDNTPWFQPPIVWLSFATFLVYFLCLREANDIDAIFDRELGDYFPDAANYEEFQRKVAQNTAVPPGRR